MGDMLEYNGLVCDMDCDNCEKCIYEVNLFEDKKDMALKQNDLSKINYCNNCVCSVCKEADISGGQLLNWYCNSKGTKRIIDMSVLSSAQITIPSWCPMGLKTNTTALATTESTKKETRKVLSWMEKKNLWEKITPICDWDKIEVNNVYHVPPVLDEKRKDIIVTNKTDFSFQYKYLSTTRGESNACIYTIYKTGYWWKFMSKHKIKKIELTKAN